MSPRVEIDLPPPATPPQLGGGVAGPGPGWATGGWREVEYIKVVGYD